MAFHWTQEAVEKLKELLPTGASAAEIGAILGISRHAVVGKVHRDKTLKAIGFKNPPRGGHLKRAGIPKRKRASVPLPPAQIEVSQPLSLMELPTYGRCKWPVEGEKEHTLFCGAYAEGTRPYCQHHIEQAWRRA